MVDNKPKFKSHVDAVSKKAHQHVHFLRVVVLTLIKAFLRMFYFCFNQISSYLFSCLLVWITIHEKQKMTAGSR